MAGFIREAQRERWEDGNIEKKNEKIQRIPFAIRSQ